MKVLIAEDSRVVTERLRILIQEIPTAQLLPPTATAHATLESVRTNCPEVLVLDAHIPGSRGMELLRTLRREKPALVLIVVSNVVYPNYRKRYEAEGADLFIDKSNEFLQLYEFIGKLAHDSWVKERDAPADPTQACSSRVGDSPHLKQSGE